MYRHPQYGMVWGEDMVTPAVRVAWPYLVAPRPGAIQKDGKMSEPKYELTLLFDKDKKSTEIFFANAQKEFDAMLAEYNRGSSGSSIALKDIKKDGDALYESDPEKYEHYKNRWVLVPKYKSKPACYSNDAEPVDIDPSLIKGGMIAKAYLTPLITSHGASYQLKGVQKIEDDGTRFGGGGVKDMKKMFAATADLPDDGEEDDVPEQPTASTPAAATAVPPAQSQARTQRNKGIKEALSRV